MRPLPLVLGLILLSGCASNYCPHNVNMSTPLPLHSRPILGDYPIVLDKTISVEGDVYILKAYAIDNQSYYLEYQPVRNFNKKLYGPFDGDPKQDLKCKE